MPRETRTLFMDHARATIETRADGTPAAIVGYGAVFYDGTPGTEFQLWRDWEGREVVERIGRTAFDRALEECDDVRALFNHDPNNLLGRTSADTMTLETDARGLRYRIPVDADDPDHTRVLRKVQRGDLTGSSFSFDVLSREIVETDKQAIRTITGVKLYDVGPVTFPAYEGTSAGVSQRDAAGALADLEGLKAEREKGAATQERAAMDVDLAIRRAECSM